LDFSFIHNSRGEVKVEISSLTKEPIKQRIQRKVIVHGEEEVLEIYLDKEKLM